MEKNERLEAANKCAERYTDEKEKRIARSAFMSGCEFEAQGEIVKGIVLEQPESKGLEEVSEALAEQHGFVKNPNCKPAKYSWLAVRDVFIEGVIAGAKWQKEQMMKEAVPFYEILKAVPPGPERENVRIIVVKED